MFHFSHFFVIFRRNFSTVPNCLLQKFHFRTLVSALPKRSRQEIEKILNNRQKFEIIYGIHPSLAVLNGRQRTVSRVFLREDLFNLPHEELKMKNPWLASAVQKAVNKFEVKSVSCDFLTVLTSGRSNQGIAIECTPIPMPSLNGVSASSLLHFNHCGHNLAKPASCCGSSSIILFLDQIQDVMNMGSILRSAVFFGIPTVLISAFFSASPSPLISKLSSGAMESLKFFRLTNPALSLKQLSKAGFIIVGTSGMQSDSLGNLSHPPPLDLCRVEPQMVGSFVNGPPRPLVLVLGSEAYGLSDSVLSSCNLIVRIPGLVDQLDDCSAVSSPLPTSLNVAAATAILLHQIKSIRS
ncbi:unnamed protein product [Rodentolepis nana]|uniref:SpoU_methylase domain-containing protein n=1 Tax=Rodentolepis nana TaxID=102285 RepID=A0A0R3T458_RODNA|nr:unnamed protein product [Rodentolepis nana]